LGPEIQNQHLNDYMVRLKDCGYSARFRSQVVQKAKKIYQNQIERDRLGIKPLYRSRELIITDRQKRNL